MCLLAILKVTKTGLYLFLENTVLGKPQWEGDQIEPPLEVNIYTNNNWQMKKVLIFYPVPVCRKERKLLSSLRGNFQMLLLHELMSDSHFQNKFILFASIEAL